MKSFLKLHIVFIFFLFGFISATHVSKVMSLTGNDSKVIGSKQTLQFENFVSQSISKTGLENIVSKSQTSKEILFLSAPEHYGEFQYFFSAQFLLPDVGTRQRFNYQLKM